VAAGVYEAYGVVVRSEWPLRGLPTTRCADIDVEIGVGAPATLRRAASCAVPTLRDDRWFRYGTLPDGSVYLCWRELFEFIISPDGRKILGRPLRTATLEAFQVYLLGQALSFSLLRLGYEPLHVTAVAFDQGAVGFAGEPGQGKSTLAAACLSSGARLVTDDVAVFVPGSDPPLVHPGPHRLKLFPNVASRFVPDLSAEAQLNDITPKLILSVPATRVVEGPTPLRLLYDLRRTSARRVTSRPLTPRAAFLLTARSAFNVMLTDTERQENQVRFAADLIERLPMRSLTYRRDLRTVGKVVERVRADIRRLG
jgi:hypothetical protein